MLNRTSNGCVDFASMADSEIVHFPATPKLVDEGDFMTDCIDAYRDAIRRNIADKDLLEPTICHEAAHRRVAEAIGLRTVMVLHRQEDGLVIPYTSAFGASIPKLAAAAVMAAPVDPSVQDMRFLNYLGYPTVAVIGARIDEWNRDNPDIHIPLPQSYSQAVYDL